MGDGTHRPFTDYEQQRLHLLRKHAIDLEDSTLGDGTRTKRLDRKDFDLLMKGSGNGGIFTWREKNRRKVCAPRVASDLPPKIKPYFLALKARLLCVCLPSHYVFVRAHRKHRCGTNSYSKWPLIGGHCRAVPDHHDSVS